MFKHSFIFALFVALILAVPTTGMSFISELINEGAVSLVALILQVIIGTCIGIAVFIIAFASDVYEQLVKGNPIIT